MTSRNIDKNTYFLENDIDGYTGDYINGSLVEYIRLLKLNNSKLSQHLDIIRKKKHDVQMEEGTLFFKNIGK